MLVPMLELNTADGSPVHWEHWWQHRPVALLFAHESCDRCRAAIRALANHSDEVPDPESVRLVITASAKTDSLPEGEHDLVHVIDPDGRLAEALGARTGVVVAADRFFEVRGAADLHKVEPAKAVDAVYDRIGLSEAECPECGAPVW